MPRVSRAYRHFSFRCSPRPDTSELAHRPGAVVDFPQAGHEVGGGELVVAEGQRDRVCAVGDHVAEPRATGTPNRLVQEHVSDIDKAQLAVGAQPLGDREAVVAVAWPHLEHALT